MRERGGSARPRGAGLGAAPARARRAWLWLALAAALAACAPAAGCGRGAAASTGSGAARAPADIPAAAGLAASFPGELFVHGPRTDRVVALTFDDGPDARFTPRILSILEREGVPATFFLVGEAVAANPGAVRRMVRDGDAIGNHTWDHPQLTRLGARGIASEMARAETAIRSVAGFAPALMRPPYGSLSPAVMRVLAAEGYRVVLWDVDAHDWRGLSAAQVRRNVLSQVRPGSIVLLHSGPGGPHGRLGGTVAALPGIIQALRDRGYRFVTLPQLLGVAAARGPGGGEQAAAAGAVPG